MRMDANDSYYGLVRVSKSIFDLIPAEMCTTGGGEYTKYLLGNDAEYNLLKSLGCAVDHTVDWYKVTRKRTAQDRKYNKRERKFQQPIYGGVAKHLYLKNILKRYCRGPRRIIWEGVEMPPGKLEILED